MVTDHKGVSHLQLAMINKNNKTLLLIKKHFVFIFQDGNQDDGKVSVIPPLSRPSTYKRGIGVPRRAKTPTEHRRYVSYCVMNIITIVLFLFDPDEIQTESKRS